MPKDNLLFKLDNLEYQFHYLNGDLDNFRPRLGNTAKLYNAKGKKTSKKVSKLLSELDISRVSAQLDNLRLEIFNNKIYHLEKSLRSLLLKLVNQYKPKKNAKTDFTQVIEDLKVKYSLEKFLELVCKSKVIKLAVGKIVPSKNVVPPNWFANHEFWKIHNDKEHEFNPSRIWLEVLLQNKRSDQLVSTLMNNDKAKNLLASFDSGMNAFLGIRKEQKSKKASEELQKGKELEAVKHGESSHSTEGDAEIGIEEEVSELDEDVLKQYDDLLGDSEEENYDQEAPMLDPNVNYNEVTDEEPDQEIDEEEELGSSEDDSDSEPQSKKQKIQLPELMGGYYSGGDDSDESDAAEDRIAAEQISLKEKKKNRRGQRARRKIWEKKYGRQAKHIQREVEKEHEDRKRRQAEYEERVAKRAAKAAVRDKEEANRLEEKSSKTIEKKPLQAEHPSWVAKKEAEEKLKNAKFQGKKITFD